MNIKHINAFALTGTIGSGKSSVLKLFEKNGFQVFNGDLIVVELYKNSHRLFSQIAESFDEWLNTSFSTKTFIDKKYLRSILEKTPNGFAKSAEIVKPYFIEECYHLCLKKNNVIIEVPLLFEMGLHSLFKSNILVMADENIRLERIKIRNPELSETQIKQVMNAQLQQEEMIHLSQHVINNSGSFAELEKNVNDMSIILNNKIIIKNKFI